MNALQCRELINIIWTASRYTANTPNSTSKPELRRAADAPGKDITQTTYLNRVTVERDGIVTSKQNRQNI